MKKTLCLLLSAIMLIGALPFVAMGASKLNLIDLQGIVPPSENAEPNWYITDNDPDYEVVNVEWFDHETGTDMLPGDRFAAGHSYRVMIYVESQNGFEFITDGVSGKPVVTVTHNGEQLDDYYLYGNEEQMLIQIDYAPFESKLVDAVEINGIDRPLVGRTPDYTGVVVSDSYKIDDEGIATIEWYDITENDNAPVMSADTKFIAGHKYRVCVWLRAINGYSFITDRDLDVKINGNSGDHYTESPVVAYVGYDFAVTSDLGTPDVKFTSTENTVTLSWNKVEGASGYRIFISQNGKWVQAVKATGAIKYTLKNLTPGTKYTYAVRAYYNTGSEIIWAPKFTSIVTSTQPAVISKVTVTKQTATAVTLSWDKVAATGYRVFQYNPSTKKWDIVVKSTKATTATITGLKTGASYIFAVRPYVNTGKEIVWAKTYTKVSASTVLPTVTITLASSAKGSATVSWNKAAGVTGYQVWYSTNKNGTYKKSGNVNANATSATVTGLTRSKTYYFKVRTYTKTDSGYAYSSWSNVSSVKVK